jgi:hypothetical protein
MQHERLGRLERDDVRRRCRPSKNPTSPKRSLTFSVRWHEHFEGAARDDEEAAVDLTAMEGQLTRRLQPRRGVGPTAGVQREWDA